MNNDHDIALTESRSETLTWLSPLEPHLRHHDIRANRVKGVGKWLLCTEEFRSWKDGTGQGESQKATMFCSGNLGVGKTYISSLVVDTLCNEAGETGEDIIVACFYFDSTAQKEQSAATVLGALLKQVVGSFDQIPDEIMDAYRRHKKLIGGRELLLPEIVKMLGSLSSTRRTFLCLDALDECGVPDRAKVLLSLNEIIEMSGTTRVFLTGRPYVGDEVGNNFSKGTTLVSISPRTEDIILYIHTKLAEDTNSGEIDERLKAGIVEKIPETVPEIFLLVSLNLDAILQESTVHRRQERLRVLTGGLGLADTYGPTLDRIKAQGGQKSKLGTAALMWICHSERELRAEELCHALVMETGSADYNVDDAPSIQSVLSHCQGLVVVDEGSIVRLTHPGLLEYMVSHGSFFQSPHSTIAETCLRYLNSQRVMALTGSSVQSTEHPPFLEYSSLYWGAHMKKELSDRGKSLAMKLFRHYECHISIRPLLERRISRSQLSSCADFHKFTGLHCASMFGLVEVVRALARMDGVDINGVDETGATPLLWAAWKGHEVVVKLLLGWKGVDPDRPENDRRTPIMWAAGNGHEAVVKLLLGREDVNPNKTDVWDRTAISWAASTGQEAVVKLLLGREDVSPDRPDVYKQAPISLAAKGGHVEVVKLLLGRNDVNPHRIDSKGRTPISLATENGHDAVVRLFHGRKKANPSKSKV